MTCDKSSPFQVTRQLLLKQPFSVWAQGDLSPPPHAKSLSFHVRVDADWSVSLLLFAIKIQLSWFRAMLVNNLAFILSLFVPLLCPSNPLFLPFPMVLITPDIISSVIEENRLAITRIKEISSQGLVPLTCGCTPRCALFAGDGWVWTELCCSLFTVSVRTVLCVFTVPSGTQGTS